MQKLLDKSDVNTEELEKLLEAREVGEVSFLLVDVREDMEYAAGHIKGVDMLKPTSVFNDWAEEMFKNTKDTKVIFTCRTGSRSGHIQVAFKKHGHKGTLNHFGGIVTYRGEVEG